MRVHPLHRRAIELDDRFVGAAHDEERWSLDARKLVARQIRPTAARNHRPDGIGPLGSRYQCRRRACARAKQPIGRFASPDSPPTQSTVATIR